VGGKRVVQSEKFTPDKSIMKPYDELTRRGKLRRLRQLAVRALEDYDLNVKWVKFMTIETNTMFKVQAEDGANYVLRIYSDTESTLKENQTEIFWLEALKKDTDLKVSDPVPRGDGEYITITAVPGVPGEKRCVLFKWSPGELPYSSKLFQTRGDNGKTARSRGDIETTPTIYPAEEMGSNFLLPR
jgi:Ser/Thr protein kinase RdoA (MazF antagonist)